MKSFALSSGSCGNSFYVENDSGEQFLVDAGLSYSKTKTILAEHGIEITNLSGIFITHEHADHCQGLPTFLKKLKCPIYLSKGTKEMLELEDDKFHEVKHHDLLTFTGTKVFVLEKSHDAREAVSYVFESAGKKLGIFTDLGYVSDEIKHVLKTLDVVYFEANYSEEMAKESNLNINYLNRLMSDKGHLSIKQTCEALVETSSDSQTIVLCHISENSNTYTHTYSTVKKTLENNGLNPRILVSFQETPSPFLE